MKREEAVSSAVDCIVADLTDRRGLKHAYETIDADVQGEIKDAWKSAILDALTAAGMVIVPREPTDLQDQAGHDAYHWFIKMTGQKQVQRRNLWQTIYRAMTEAYNG